MTAANRIKRRKYDLEGKPYPQGKEGRKARAADRKKLQREMNNRNRWKNDGNRYLTLQERKEMGDGMVRKYYTVGGKTFSYLTPKILKPAQAVTKTRGYTTRNMGQRSTMGNRGPHSEKGQRAEAQRMRRNLNRREKRATDKANAVANNRRRRAADRLRQAQQRRNPNNRTNRASQSRAMGVRWGRRGTAANRLTRYRSIFDEPIRTNTISRARGAGPGGFRSDNPFSSNLQTRNTRNRVARNNAEALRNITFDLDDLQDFLF